jgi:GT2 family glycosyltransferase
VLTFCAPESLASAIEAIERQTVVPDELLVVDNGSEPPAQLDTRGVIPTKLLRRPLNDGPAGGHARAIEWFLESSACWLWILDDDCLPEPTCLEHLLRATGPDCRYVAPTWMQPGEIASTYPAWNGPLLHRHVVEQIGLPRQALVWWGEDTEYLAWRTRRAGISRTIVTDAVVHHTRTRTPPTGHRPSWKYYYEARNIVYLRTRFRRHPEWIPRFLARLVGRVLLRENHRLRKLAFVARGIIDGALGRLGVRVPLSTP